MHVLVVFAHPVRSSFNGAVLDRVASELERLGHSTELADLYREAFSPLLTAADLEAVAAGTTTGEVRAELDRLLRADALVLVYPTWWYGPPAVLKGWLDRVLAEHVAVEIQPDGTVEGLLPHRAALALTTTGADRERLEAEGTLAAMERQVEVTLGSCGVDRVRLVALTDAEAGGDERRTSLLDKVASVIADELGPAC